MSLPIPAVLELLEGLDTAFGLAGRMVDLAKQREPRLRTTPILAEDDAMRAAREAALKP